MASCARSQGSRWLCERVLYSGMLIASLVIPSFEKPINGLTDIPAAIKDGFTLVVTADSSNQYIFKDAKGGIYEDTWNLFDNPKSFLRKSDDAFRGGILEEKFVLVNGQLSSRYLAMNRGIRRYYFARDTFGPQYYGVACFPGSPFLPTFNKLLSYITEAGLITKWVDNEFEKVAGKHDIVENGGPRPFTITQLQAAFYILPIGLLLAAVVLSMELLCAVM